MLKVAWLVRLSHEHGTHRDERWDRYAPAHARLLAAVPGLERATENRTLAIVETPQAGIGEPTIDSIVCTWWADRAAIERALATQQWQALSAHARACSGGDWPHGGPAMEVEERTMRIGAGTPWRGAAVPAAMCKHVGVLHYRPDLPREDASEYWTREHGRIALEVPEILYYVQDHARRPLSFDGAPLDGRVPFDGFSEAWFADRETFEHSHASPAWLRLQADSPNLFDVEAIESGVNCVVAERVLSEPA